MKEAYNLGKAVDAQKFGCGAAVKCLIFMLAVLSVLNPAMLPPYGLEYERTKLPSAVDEKPDFNAMNSGSGDVRHLLKLKAEVQSDDSAQGKEELEEIKGIASIIESKGNIFINLGKEELEEIKGIASIIESKESGKIQSSVHLNLGQDEASSDIDPPADNSGIICDFSDYKYNMCSIAVPLKVIGSSGNVLLIPPTSTTPVDTIMWKVRPFTRKWEDVTRERVREMTIQWASHQNQGPACDVTHDVPVLIFSTEGFPFNPFHAYTDLLIPLFVAADRYHGKLKFGITNFNWPWLNMYMPFINSLSHYPLINLDSETQVHCFPSGQVGLVGTSPLTVDNSSAQNGYTTQDFRKFVRTSLSLERFQVQKIEKNSNKKPKIGILLRKGTRIFTNENEIVEMAEGVGFEVIRLHPETTSDFPRIAHLINSCDVLMGLHGAGLTNMIYLPNNATVLQIIPLGNLRFISWKDYGEPTKDMGLNYVEYEIKEEESTLIEKYPRNHTVFTNPEELHNQGWMPMYTVYLVEQSVRLDVNRFRKVLADLFNNSLTSQQRRK